MGYLFNNLNSILKLLGEHLFLTFASLGIALIVAIPIGVLVLKYRRFHTPITSLLGLIYTIPSLALFATLIPYTGLGKTTAIIGLVAYSQMILVRNIVAAIDGIDPLIIESAKGMGMTKWQILRRIEVPLAVPVVLAGIRVATVSIISIASIAAWIGAGGLGSLIFQGLRSQHTEKIIAGTISIALLAILADIIFRMLDKAFRPKIS
ncbi:ABC transporter permease [Metasolibacillus sp. FSL H7-0170]|uniref:ABC transporter permease n=1 Tax=Metasolibacillus TaxID=2703677 RepID=UPI000D399666|nr:ABC transporter permease [Metasolibacillus fluoroglycofenilyticus]